MVPFTIIRIGHVLFFGLSVDVELHPHAPHLQSQRYLAPSLLWMEFAEVFEASLCTELLTTYVMLRIKMVFSFHCTCLKRMSN